MSAIDELRELVARAAPVVPATASLMYEALSRLESEQADARRALAVVGEVAGENIHYWKGRAIQGDVRIDELESAQAAKDEALRKARVHVEDALKSERLTDFASSHLLIARAALSSQGGEKPE